MSLVKDLKLNKLGMSHLLLLVAVFALIYGFNNYNSSKMPSPYEGMSPLDESPTNEGSMMMPSLSEQQPHAQPSVGGGSGNVQFASPDNSGFNGTPLSAPDVFSNEKLEDPGKLLPKDANMSSLINDNVTKPLHQTKGRNIPVGNQLLRGEIPNPKNVKCPWNISTIEYVERPSICGSCSV